MGEKNAEKLVYAIVVQSQEICNEKSFSVILLQY